MHKKLNCILLIDDNEADNFLHERVINKMNCAKKVVSVQSGEAALEFLISKGGKSPNPDLVFLDINMPGMNGWEFLERYNKLDEAQKAKIIVVMLTTSLNNDDEDKAGNQPAITDFRNKPLTKELLAEVLKIYFPELQEKD